MPFIKSTYEYTKSRKTFGSQCLFQDAPPVMLDSINPNKDDQKQYILRNPVHQASQATSMLSEHDANTKIVEMHEASMNHTEGGWPKDVHLNNEEHTARYCRRCVHEEGYIHSVISTAPVIEHYIAQNNAIEMYESYYSNMEKQEPVEQYSIRITNTFRDLIQRPVSCITWTNEKNSKLVVAYSYKTFRAETGINTLNNCYLWDINNQTEPLVILHPDSSCWQLVCSPADPDILITGLENGTVGLHDLRQGSRSVASSSIYNSHRGPITSLHYTHTRNHTEFYSGSTDGQCHFWDCRNLSKPEETIPMSIRITPKETPHIGNSEGISSIGYDNGVPSKLLCGTESGLVINVNRMGKTHREKVYMYWDAHHGPVRTVRRSPCTLRMFLTCGDSTVRIWSEEVRTAPIIVTKPYRYEVTDAAWAPLRYSSYMSICAGGYFYYWDMLRKSQEPIATLHVSKHELTRLTPHSDGHSIAIGDKNGVVYLVQPSINMIESGKRDKVLTFQIYERETHREHILDNRLKEIRLKAKKNEEEILKHMDEQESLEEIQEEDELEIAAEADYFRIVDQELRLFENVTPHASIH